MTRKLPLVPTMVVLTAVVVMVMLGRWQLQRAEWKEGLLEHYHTAQSTLADVPWPASPDQYEAVLYRHSRVDCVAVKSMNAISGRSEGGEAGWSHIAQCVLPDGGVAEVALGWSRDPAWPGWEGGEVGGVIGPAGENVRLVIAPAQAGLEQLALPDPNDLPNNHMAYAIQWFLFALTALAIYGLVLRSQWRASGE